jgi:hypothetical protein
MNRLIHLRSWTKYACHVQWGWAVPTVEDEPERVPSLRMMGIESHRQTLWTGHRSRLWLFSLLSFHLSLLLDSQKELHSTPFSTHQFDTRGSLSLHTTFPRGVSDVPFASVLTKSRLDSTALNTARAKRTSHPSRSFSVLFFFSPTSTSSTVIHLSTPSPCIRSS